jgi:outer membrane protein OmpA-like peptidoglycan-associated protein
MSPSGALVVLVATVAALAAGCATKPAARAPGTTVILLPDESGSVGSVVVSTRSGEQRLDEAFSYAVAERASLPPSSALPSAREAVEAGHRPLLASQPTAPRTFVLHFLLNEAVLTEASRALLPAVIAAAGERQPTEVTVFGHADASGTEAINMKLSAHRAQVVADLLRAHEPNLGTVLIQYFGDKAPLVRSEGRRPDPRNRRVEVMIL